MLDHGLHEVAAKSRTENHYQVGLMLLDAGANPDPVSDCLCGIFEHIVCQMFSMKLTYQHTSIAAKISLTI